jgi:anti-sigma regulatory factor (Ser/Thr protein kinase)
MTPDRFDDVVVLTMPARTELAATLRVVAASLGADVGLTVDEIDDIRLAVNEVFASAAEGTPNSTISVSFAPGDGRLDIAIELTDGRPIPLDQLAATVLESVVDVTGPLHTSPIRFTKRATEAAL